MDCRIDRWIEDLSFCLGEPCRLGERLVGWFLFFGGVGFGFGFGCTRARLERGFDEAGRGELTLF